MPPLGTTLSTQPALSAFTHHRFLYKLNTFQPSTFNPTPSIKMLSKTIISAILAWPALVAAAPHNVEERAAAPELTLTQKLRLADT